MWLSQLLNRRLLFVTGKGGVGKTTVSGAIALHAVARGRRVLLCEVVDRSAFGRIFGVDDVGAEPRSASDRLWLANLEPEACLISFLTRFVKVRRLARALVRNRVARRFFEAAPGVLETVVLERVAELALGGFDDRSFDLVIVDLPSTGHAVSFLGVPRTLARLVKVGRLAEYLDEVADRLSDPDFAELLLVSQPEEMPVQETIELWQAANRQLQVRLETVVVNRVRRSGLDTALAERLLALEHDTLERATPLRAARLIALWESRERRLIERLHQAIEARFAEIPWIPERSNEVDLLTRIVSQWESETGDGGTSPRASRADQT